MALPSAFVCLEEGLLPRVRARAPPAGPSSQPYVRGLDAEISELCLLSCEMKIKRASISLG